jgi:hypothetical protein
VRFEEANRRRLSRHGLSRPLGSLTEAAAAMAGVHAQVMSAAEVSLGLRVSGATRADVAAALIRLAATPESGVVHVVDGPYDYYLADG